MPDALNYYAFRDQNLLTPQALANQPGLSPDEAIRRIALTPGATFRPGEFETLMQMAATAKEQQGQRDQINQYYDSSDRHDDIERAVAPNEQQAYAALEQSLRAGSREGAFARARSGNFGGSVQASQTAQLAGAGAGQGARLAAGFAGDRDNLQAALDSARTSELMGTYNQDPLRSDAINQQLHTYGVQGDSNAAMEALRQQNEALHNNQNDEYSRLLGNAVNIGGGMYQQYQQNGMMNDYQNYLNGLRNRGGGTSAPMTGSPSGVGA